MRTTTAPRTTSRTSRMAAPSSPRHGRRGRRLALAVVAATSSLAVSSGSAVALHVPEEPGEPMSETHRERGYVLECLGVEIGRGAGDRTAYVTLYENDAYLNDLHIIIDGKPRLSASRNPADIIDRGDVKVRARINGHRAVVVGNLGRDKRRTPVREVIESDAGKRIVSEGFHRAVRSDLGLLYRGANFQLECDPAFYYDLRVTSTDVA